MKILSRGLTALIVLVFFAYCAVAAQAEPLPRHVQLRLVPEKSPVAGGETILIGIEQTILAGWHTYWINPGDSGQPMHVKWDLPPGFTVSSLRWPVPHMIQLGTLVSFGYLDKAVILQELTLPDPLPKGPITLHATTETLVCADTCIPEFDNLTLTLNDGNTVDNSAYIDDANNDMPSDISGTWDSFYRVNKKGEFQMTVGLTNPALLSDRQGHAHLNFIPYDWGAVDNASKPVIGMNQDKILEIRKKLGPKPLESFATLHALLTYVDNDGKRAAFEITGRPDPAWLKERAEAAQPHSIFDARTVASLPAALILALLGGLILNLMPCVFPVLSMKALSLLHMTDRERNHARLHGLAYMAGIVLCFVTIAGTLLALKAAGAGIGWGFQLQSPPIVLGLSWLLFVIGLNFSGVFEVGGRFTDTGGSLARKSGLTGSFFTGVLAAVVATPCTAPFMAAAVGYALVQPAPVALAIFIALGVGLALPYLAICFLPPLQRLLPRPGAWMQTLREFLAFPMYASAAWLVWVYTMQTGVDGVLYALTGIVLIALIVWLARRMSPHGAGRMLAALCIFAATAGLAGLVWTSRSQPTAKVVLPARGGVKANIAVYGAPEPFSADKLEGLLAGPDPVFVDMTAAWCITCKINERVALNSMEVRAAFQAQHVRYLVGDWTSQNPAITAYLSHYGRQGVPLYVYYAPPGSDGKRPAPEILPQILTPKSVSAMITQPKKDSN